MVSICVNENGIINGFCPDDLSGGNGWVYVDGDMPIGDCVNEYGIPLYKYEGGGIIRRTDAEIEADAIANAPAVEEPQKSAEEQLAELREALEALLRGDIE